MTDTRFTFAIIALSDVVSDLVTSIIILHDGLPVVFGLVDGGDVSNDIFLGLLEFDHIVSQSLRVFLGLEGLCLDNFSLLNHILSQTHANLGKSLDLNEIAKFHEALITNPKVHESVVSSRCFSVLLGEDSVVVEL